MTATRLRRTGSRRRTARRPRLSSTELAQSIEVSDTKYCMSLQSGPTPELTVRPGRRLSSISSTSISSAAKTEARAFACWTTWLFHSPSTRRPLWHRIESDICGDLRSRADNPRVRFNAGGMCLSSASRGAVTGMPWSLTHHAEQPDRRRQPYRQSSGPRRLEPIRAPPGANDTMRPRRAGRIFRRSRITLRTVRHGSLRDFGGIIAPLGRLLLLKHTTVSSYARWRWIEWWWTASGHI
jgi:hypothetical protein